MKIYGYQKDDDTLLKLEEMSLQCTIEELEKIIVFLKKVKMEHEKVSSGANICHSHWRDWDLTWTEGEPDIIIVTSNNVE